MQITVIEIKFNALGQEHRVLDKELQANEVYEQEISKVSSLAYITSIGHVKATAEEYLEKSFTRLKSWNNKVEQYNELNDEQ